MGPGYPRIPLVVVSPITSSNILYVIKSVKDASSFNSRWLTFWFSLDHVLLVHIFFFLWYQKFDLKVTKLIKIYVLRKKLKIFPIFCRRMWQMFLKKNIIYINFFCFTRPWSPSISIIYFFDSDSKSQNPAMIEWFQLLLLSNWLRSGPGWTNSLGTNSLRKY